MMRKVTYNFKVMLGLLLAAGMLSPVVAQSAAEQLKVKAGPAPKRPPPKSFELTKEQKDRVRQLLPKSYDKLSQRAPFHVVAIGDDVIEMQGPGPDAGDLLKAYPAQFLTELAGQFFYTGGVRLIRPAKGMPDKAGPMLGPEITLRSLGRNGITMLHAMQTLTTYAYEAPPDLVLVSFGVNDAQLGLELGAYARATQEVIDTIRAQGAEVLLLGPTLPADEPTASSMGRVRAYTDTLREIATENKVPFADLGDLSVLMKLLPTTLEPAKVLDDVTDRYRRFFAGAQGQDYVHPLAELQSLLGRSVAGQLLNGPKPSDWAVTSGIATLTSSQEFTLTYKVKNTTDKPLSVSIQPLPTARWVAKEGAQVVELKPGKSQELTAIYTQVTSANATLNSAFSSHEPQLRLPVLVAAGGMVRIEDIRAELRPIAVVWKMDSLFNQEGSFTLDNLLVNTSGTALKGLEWNAEWSGQSLSGKVDVAAAGRETLALKFNLPKGESRREASPLTLTVNVNGMSLRWQRFLEVQKNFGLRDSLDLRHPGSKGSVRVRADADANALFLTYDFASLDFVNNAQGTALLLALNIDARSFGKRLNFGATEAISVQCGAADGAGTTSRIAPWAYGTGYGMGYDPAAVTSQLSSSSNGLRRFTVTLPRSYLYLHEWAIGNGNSQIGLGMSFSVWQGPHDGQTVGGYTPDMTFRLNENGRLADDAERLPVLELTDKPTQRWSVIIW